jgi:hypothetical protein
MTEQKDEIEAVLVEIYNSFWREGDGSHSAYLGDQIYDRIKQALKIARPTIVEMPGSTGYVKS